MNFFIKQLGSCPLESAHKISFVSVVSLNEPKKKIELRKPWPEWNVSSGIKYNHNVKALNTSLNKLIGTFFTAMVLLL